MSGYVFASHSSADSVPSPFGGASGCPSRIASSKTSVADPTVAG